MIYCNFQRIASIASMRTSFVCDVIAWSHLKIKKLGNIFKRNKLNLRILLARGTNETFSLDLTWARFERERRKLSVNILRCLLEINILKCVQITCLNKLSSNFKIEAELGGKSEQLPPDFSKIFLPSILMLAWLWKKTKHLIIKTNNYNVLVLKVKK